MAREISLFNTYHQKENRVTNYIGLMLKLLYEEDAIAFRKALNILLNDSWVEVGPCSANRPISQAQFQT